MSGIIVNLFKLWKCEPKTLYRLIPVLDGQGSVPSDFKFTKRTGGMAMDFPWNHSTCGLLISGNERRMRLRLSIAATGRLCLENLGDLLCWEVKQFHYEKGVNTAVTESCCLLQSKLGTKLEGTEIRSHYCETSFENSGTVCFLFLVR